MALAILDLVAFEHGNARFRIDTGTNQFYQLKAGRSVRARSGMDWVDEVFYSSPLTRNEGGGQLLSPPKEISVPLRRLDQGNVYAQLFSYKNLEGTAPAFSDPVLLRMGLTGVGLPFSITTSMNTTTSFRTARTIPCRSYAESYAQQASLEDLLSGVLKVAGPLVSNLLGAAQGGGAQTGGAASAADSSGPAGLLALLLKTLLGAAQGAPGLSKPQSIHTPALHGNRFLEGEHTGFSRPFIFGIDDALLGAIAGPLLQILPQLMNSANQKRVDLQKADNRLVSDIVSDVNRRRLLEQLIQAQHSAPAGGAGAASSDDAAQMNALIQLLQQVPAAPAAAPAASAPALAAAPVAAKSLSAEDGSPQTLSRKAVLTLVTADPVAWNGKPQALFAKNQPLQIKVKLTVGEPVPKSPLAKAILRVMFKNPADQSVYCEKTFKQKGVLPNTVLALRFDAADLAALPVNQTLTLLAEMRWRSSNGEREYKALGSGDLVFVNKYFLKEQGSEVSPEKELTDMQRYRAFWNKIWESPTLDAASGMRKDQKKYLWELDVNAKYSVLLNASQPSNGFMQTKILRGPADAESMTERIDGRMKGGIELSLAELNKLLPLWDGAASLDAEKLEALGTAELAKNNGWEMMYRFKLQGKTSERGLVWVVPVFKLFEFTLSVVGSTDDSGQVTAVSDEKVKFPLPVAVRVIGLKSA